MKALLAGRSRRKSIGLLVGERELGLCVMAATPLGRAELLRASEPRGPEPLGDQLGRMLDPWLQGRPRPRVVLGVPEVRVFHSSRALDASARKDPATWLQEALQTAGTRAEDMVIELGEAAVGRQTVGSLVACRKKSLAEPLEALARRSARLVLVEPAPCALLRAATGRLKAPRGSKLSARFLLGDRQAIGICAAGALPLQWRVFDLPPGGEASAIHSSLVAFRMQARQWQVEANIDAVLIQGRPDLSVGLDPAQLESRMGVRVARADAPGFDPGSIALGLAMGGLAEEGGFDLSRAFKQPEMIGEIFPWGDLVLQSVMLAGILLMVSDRARWLDGSLASTQSALRKFAWLGNRQEAELDAEKRALQLKDRTAEAFLASRVSWSGHLQDVASLLPPSTKLNSLAGTAELEDLSGKGAARTPKKSLVLRLESPIPPTGETPREVDELLEAVRDRPRLRRDFHVVEIKDIKAARGTGKDAGMVASYTIVGLPAPPKPTTPKPAAK